MHGFTLGGSFGGRECEGHDRHAFLIGKGEYAVRGMCLVGWYFEMAGTVNSPRRAMEKKDTVRQAKMAASRGSERFKSLLKIERMSVVKGVRLGRLDESGESLVTPSRMALYSVSFMCQSSPCKMCQALRAAA